MKNCETFNETRIIMAGKRGLKAIIPEAYREKIKLEKGDILSVTIDGDMYIISPAGYRSGKTYKVGYYRAGNYYRLTITIKMGYTIEYRLTAGMRLNTEILGDKLILTPQEAERE